MRAVAVLALGALMCGCSEYAEFHSSPQPANVFLNDQLIGTTPMEYPIPRGAVHNTWNYRVEANGYATDSGILRRHVAPGRIVAAVFTMCITCAFRGFQYFEPVDATLMPINGANTRGTAPATGAKGSLEDRLQQLDSVYDKGLINESEYRKKRSEILDEF